MNANLYALLADHFPEEGEQPCIVLPRGPVIHYDDLEVASARMANVLVDEGCRPGDRVAVQVDKCWQALALYLGCLRAGLVYLPLNSAYRRGELDFFFADAAPTVIVTAPENEGLVLSLRPQARFLTLAGSTGSLADQAADAADRFETVRSRPDDLAAILYTSGTTGRSKGAMLTHRNLASNALTLVEHWNFTRGDVLLHALPVYHVHGLFVACHCVLLSGSRMLWLPRFDAREVIEMLPHATVMMGVPTFYSRMVGEPTLAPERCETIRVFISGSAPLRPETFKAFQAKTGQCILERYGMTETGMNTSNPLDGERVCGAVGPALPGVSLRVVDAEGETVDAGVVGDVQVKGANVFHGYWGLPEKNEEEFTPDGYFRTGDMGELLPNGYLRIVGRAKDLIISGGLNVYPKEIEDRLDRVPGVHECAVIGVPDADFGETVTAIVVTELGQSLTECEVIAALREDIASFKVPKRVIFVPELPRNAMGKVQKNLLREQFAEQLFHA